MSRQIQTIEITKSMKQKSRTSQKRLVRYYSFVIMILILLGSLSHVAAQVPSPTAIQTTKDHSGNTVNTSVVTQQVLPKVVTQQVLLPGTTAHDLAEVAQKELSKLMSEGPCPCDPSKTLLQCIQAQTCPSATSLAEFGVQKYKAGMGTEQVTEAVINKFIEEFTPPVEFDLSKTPLKGRPDAPITIVEFADFECPHCSLMAGIMSEVLKARPNAVKIYFKQFPLPFHQLAPLASRATLAAHKQGAFWAMHDLIFSQQDRLKEASFMEFAEQLGLNLMIYRADFASEEVIKQVESEREEGVKAGLQGTPTLYFNGKIFRGEATKEAILEHIDSLLKKNTEKGSGK